MLTSVTDMQILDEVFKQVCECRGLVRLAIGKFVNEEGQFCYKKFVDFNVDHLLKGGGENDLKKVIFALIKACDLEGVLVPTDEGWYSEKESNDTNKEVPILQKID